MTHNYKGAKVGSVKVEVIGGGNWEGSCPCFLVYWITSELIIEGVMIDCGAGSQSRFLHLDRMHLPCLQGLFITHFHGDHFTDALSLVDYRTLFEATREQELSPFTVLGPLDIVSNLQALRRMYGSEDLDKGHITTHEARGVGHFDLVTALGVHVGVDTIRVPHMNWEKDVCLAYRVAVGGKTAVFTGDINGPLDLEDPRYRRGVDFMKGADIAVIEAGASELTNTPRGHLWCTETVALARAGGAKRVLVNHVPLSFQSHVWSLLNSINMNELLEPANQLISLAEDGMILKL